MIGSSRLRICHEGGVVGKGGKGKGGKGKGKGGKGGGEVYKPIQTSLKRVLPDGMPKSYHMEPDQPDQTPGTYKLLVI